MPPKKSLSAEAGCRNPGDDSDDSSLSTVSARSTTLKGDDSDDSSSLSTKSARSMAEQAGVSSDADRTTPGVDSDDSSLSTVSARTMSRAELEVERGETKDTDGKLKY